MAGTRHAARRAAPACALGTLPSSGARGATRGASGAPASRAAGSMCLRCIPPVPPLLRCRRPSFRDSEVVWENVRVLPDGETVSVDGTHLGHDLPDGKGNRYCINLVCIAGSPQKA